MMCIFSLLSRCNLFIVLSNHSLLAHLCSWLNMWSVNLWPNGCRSVPTLYLHKEIFKLLFACASKRKGRPEDEAKQTEKQGCILEVLRNSLLGSHGSWVRLHLGKKLFSILCGGVLEFYYRSLNGKTFHAAPGRSSEAASYMRRSHFY